MYSNSSDTILWILVIRCDCVSSQRYSKLHPTKNYWIRLGCCWFVDRTITASVSKVVLLLARVMATASQADSRRKYSWWWDSHISPKNSRWLQENLTGLYITGLICNFVSCVSHVCGVKWNSLVRHHKFLIM